MVTTKALLDACLHYDSMGFDVAEVVQDVLHFDDQCGRGWEGTKPGCTRKKKGAAATPAPVKGKRLSKEERDNAKLAVMHKKQFIANIEHGVGSKAEGSSDKEKAKLAKIRARDLAKTDVAKKHGLTAAELEGILRKKYGLDGGQKKKGFTKEEREARWAKSLYDIA